MSRKFLRRTADGAGQGVINPAGRSDLILYLRADSADLASLAEGAPVNTWNDLSTFAQNLSKSMAGTAPVYRKSATPGGHPGVDFNLATVALAAAWNAAVVTAGVPNGVTVYTLFKLVSPATQPQYVFNSPQGAGSLLRTLAPSTTDFGGPAGEYEYETATGRADAFGAVTSGYQDLILVLNPPVLTASKGQMYSNGALLTQDFGTGDWNWFPTGSFAIGGQPTGSAFQKGIIVANLVFSSAHNAGTRAGIRGYLRGVLS